MGGDFYHLVLGAFFLFAGFRLRGAGEQELRMVVGGLGAFTLLAKMPLIFLATSPHVGHRPVEVTCVVVGGASTLAAVFLPGMRASGRGG